MTYDGALDDREENWTRRVLDDGREDGGNSVLYGSVGRADGSSEEAVSAIKTFMFLWRSSSWSAKRV